MVRPDPLPFSLHKAIIQEMDDNRIVARLDRIVEGVEKIVAAIPGSASRIRRVVDLVTTIIAVLGILSVADILINWLGG
jgi:hypothetical protein